MAERNGGGVIRVVVAATSAVRRGELEAAVRRHSSLKLAGLATALSGLSSRAHEIEADVVVADLAAPDAQFLTTSTLLEQAGIAVVALIDNPDANWTARALRAGIRAILPREASAAEIVAAVSAADSGLVLLDPDVTRELTAQMRVRDSEGVLENVEELTSREVEVLLLMAEGFGNKEIASRLGITDHTVKFHISSILAKLGASSRTEAVTQGIRMGLILI
jgi:NarL family two-component system response regulator YdfI